MVYIWRPFGGLAQLARALRWQRRGHRFESDILHSNYPVLFSIGFFVYPNISLNSGFVITLNIPGDL